MSPIVSTHNNRNDRPGEPSQQKTKGKDVVKYLRDRYPQSVEEAQDRLGQGVPCIDVWIEAIKQNGSPETNEIYRIISSERQNSPDDPSFADALLAAHIENPNLPSAAMYRRA